MSPATNKRLHGWAVAQGLTHDSLRDGLARRGWVGESLRELSEEHAQQVIELLRVGGMAAVPPCPHTPVAREIEEQKPAAEEIVDGRRRFGNGRPRRLWTAVNEWTGHRGFFGHFQHCAARRKAPVTFAHGSDDGRVARIRRAHTEEECQTLVRRFWGLEPIPAGERLQAYLERPGIVRTLALLEKVAPDLLPEKHAPRPGAYQEVQNRVKEAIRKERRRRRPERSARPISGGEFANAPAVQGWRPGKGR